MQKQPDPARRTSRNESCYRTVAGERYQLWRTDAPSRALRSALLLGGARCAWLGRRIWVHPLDGDVAMRAERAWRAAQAKRAAARPPR